MTFQNAIFDMDGTLFASEQYWRRAHIEAIGKVYGVIIPENEWEPLLSLWYNECNEYVLKRCGVKVDPEALREPMRAAMQKYYDSADIPRTPYSLEFIQAIRENGARIAIATSTPKYLCEGFLERMGIAPYIDGLFTTEMTSHGKASSPEVYDLALECVGGTKKNTLVFEDTLDPILTLHKASYRIVGVKNPQMARVYDKIEPLCELFLSSFKEAFDKYELQRAQ